MPQVLEARNAMTLPGGRVQLEVRFAGIEGVGEDEWLPFVADPNDCTEYGPELHARAMAGEFGPIVPYVPPPAPVPQVVTRRQGRLALLNAGLLDDVEAAIDAIADPAAKRAAQIEYEADTWERGNAFLQAMWAQLGGTEEQLDQLFITAAGL